jgi:outer membrane lipoprotein SlyB
MKQLVIVLGLAGMLAACGPAQPPSDPNAQQTPPAAAAGASGTSLDQQEAQLEAQKQQIEQQEAQIRAQRQAQQGGAQPAPVQQAAAPAQPACQDCGVVASITPVKREGKAGWIGTLGGAAVGGLLGNQFGRGKGNTAMTAVGVVGGALAGREVQKRVDTTTVYRVGVRMETGSHRTVTVADASSLTVGSRVHVSGNNLMPY